MSTLSPKGHALVRAAGRSYQPTGVDRERVADALRARIGAEALPPDLGPLAATASASHSILRILSAVVAGIGIVGGTVFLVQRSARVEDGMEKVAPITAPAPAAEPMPAPAAEPAQAGLPAPSPDLLVPPSGNAPRDRLAAEVALLTRATRDLRAGHPADALKTLDEYRRKFPKGLLGEQHRAGRAQVLCALGRFEEATAGLAELPPKSPLAVRAREFCDSALASR